MQTHYFQRYHSKENIVVSQKNFKIQVETKLYEQFEEKQLENHLVSFDEIAKLLMNRSWE